MDRVVWASAALYSSIHSWDRYLTGIAAHPFQWRHTPTLSMAAHPDDFQARLKCHEQAH